MKAWRRTLHAACGAICGVGLGCAPATTSYPNATVEGTVQIDGRSVDQGSIQFLPLHAAGPAVGGPIEQGRYVVAGVPCGKVRVLIQAMQRLHRLPLSEDGIEKWATRQLTPEANRAGWEIDVRADRRFDLQLASRPSP